MLATGITHLALHAHDLELLSGATTRTLSRLDVLSGVVGLPRLHGFHIDDVLLAPCDCVDLLGL